MTRLDWAAETGYSDGTQATIANSDDGSETVPLDNAVGTALTYAGTPTPIQGSLSLRANVPSSAGNVYARFGSASLAGTTLAWRVYFILDAYSGTGNNVIIRTLTSGNGSLIQLRLSSSRVPSLLNAAAGTLATGSALTIGQLYRFEVWATAGTTTTDGRADVSLYEGHDTTPILTYGSLAMNAGTTGARKVELGRSGTAAGAYDIRYDWLAVDDSVGENYLGPAVVQQTGAVQFDATSAFSVAALGQYLGAMQANAVSTVSMAPLAQPRGAVTVPGTSGVSFGPSASASVRADAVSTVSFAPVVAGAGGVAFAATSAVSFAPLAQKRAALQVDAVSTVSMAPLARRLGGFTVAGASAVSFAPLARFIGGGAFAATSSVSFAPTTPPRGARVYFRGELIERAYHRGEQVVIR